MPKKNRNKQFRSNDSYHWLFELEQYDIDGDGTIDVVAECQVHKNGQLFQRTVSSWHGLDDQGRDAVMGSFGEVTTEFITSRFRDIVKGWKELAKALQNLTKAGDAAADQLGEE